mmetsp:Transcript_24237/g.37362  ORF Transcript_24237/g.37362 Transcript_24237/m.37362 type:complete len:108 (+) Transcript_24237:390-713(+)
MCSNMYFDLPDPSKSKDNFDQVFNFFLNIKDFLPELHIDHEALNFVPETINLLGGPLQGPGALEKEENSNQINSFSFGNNHSFSQNNVDNRDQQNFPGLNAGQVNGG